MHPRFYSREELSQRVVTLLGEGISRRAIARTLSVSRNTVRKILRVHKRAREQPHTALPTPPKRALRSKKTDAYRAQIEKLLTKYDNITAQRVFEIVQEAGYDGGYTAVKELVRSMRPVPKPPPSRKPPQ